MNESIGSKDIGLQEGGHVIIEADGGSIDNEFNRFGSVSGKSRKGSSIGQGRSRYQSGKNVIQDNIPFSESERSNTGKTNDTTRISTASAALARPHTATSQ